MGKQLQILRELVPQIQIVAVLMNPDTPFTALACRTASGRQRGTTAARGLPSQNADEVRIGVEPQPSLALVA